MAILKKIFSITYELSIDEFTGEIIETKILDKKIPSNKSIKEEIPESDVATLYLKDNKCILNSAAIKLMNITPGDKIDIKYDDLNGTTIPIIGTDESFGTKGGNVLSKSFSISCRGKKREVLSKYGEEFIVKVHPNKDEIFLLTNDNIVVKNNIIEDENIKIPEDIDLDLTDFVDAEDNTCIDSNFFKL